jgi:hypothetical protein
MTFSASPIPSARPEITAALMAQTGLDEAILHRSGASLL